MHYLKETLTPIPHWLVWRYGHRAHDKESKYPYKCDDSPANSRFPINVHNPANWTTYQTASTFLQQHSAYNGLGFVLTPDCELVCVDIDWKHNNPQQPTQQQIDIVNAFIGRTYIEWSPSGLGVHIWCRGYADVCKRAQVEIYSEKRYITVTFQTIKDGNTGEDIGNVPLGDWQTLSTIIDAQALLPFSTGVDEPSMPTGLRNDVAALLRYPPDPLTEQDHNLIKIAARAKNGEKFKSLARGEWEGKYPSQSEADLALCNIVAFYTDDVAQVARIFHASALGQRRDAYQAHYLIPTLNRAFDRHNRRLPTVSLTSLGGA